MKHTFIVTVEIDDKNLDAPEAQSIANEIQSTLEYDSPPINGILSVVVRTIQDTDSVVEWPVCGSCRKGGNSLVRMKGQQAVMSGTYMHPLDAVESALVTASNALSEALDNIGYDTGIRVDQAIDLALVLVQSIIQRDFSLLERTQDDD